MFMHIMDTLGNSETRKIGGNIPPEKEVQRCRKHDRKIMKLLINDEEALSSIAKRQPKFLSTKCNPCNRLSLKKEGNSDTYF